MDETVQTPRRRLVFVVSRDRIDLYDRLREALIREPDVDLILDRRAVDRRVADSAIERERRGLQRRERAAVNAEVRECGWAVFRLPGRR
ncbi:MAG TPA: hypothetical protein VHZ49_21525 [Methylomirabilota bacterium]|jgi:hypothetical protein|nr:hypothetical protein [Methylomirabilota bacterium]